MTRLQKVQQGFKGEITVFLSLVFILLLSIVGALIESASIQITKSRKRADTLLALESVFAEYHQGMLETYDLFVKVGTSERAVKERLAYYGADGQDHSVEGLELLSDHQGKPFYEQAIRYVKNWFGDVEDAGIDHDFTVDGALEKEEERNREELEAILKEEQVELPKENNPITSIDTIRNSSILSSVVPDSHTVSNRNLNLEVLASKRELQKGNWDEHKTKDNPAEKALFVTYLTEHFSDMTECQTERTMMYEQEYLLIGNKSDQKNLEEVCDTILDIRTALNYGYLQTDAAKKMEAEIMARTICGLIQLPGVVTMVKQSILYGWAYGESVVDVRALLNGKKVAAVKSKSTWQLSLSDVMGLGLGIHTTVEKDVKGGLDYQTYLTGLLMLEDNKNLCMRSLNLIESNMQIKTDQCVTKLALKSEVKLRYGVQNTYMTVYGYQ